MRKHSKKIGALALSATLAATSVYAGEEVFGYGETVEKAQEMALRVAKDAAASKDTCTGSITTCIITDGGLFRCGAMVANHKGSCNKDGSDLAKLKEVLGL